jgi:hypothetical protein
LGFFFEKYLAARLQFQLPYAAKFWAWLITVDNLCFLVGKDIINDYKPKRSCSKLGDVSYKKAEPGGKVRLVEEQKKVFQRRFRRSFLSG